MAQFPNCEVQPGSDQAKPSQHAFQVGQVTVKPKAADNEKPTEYAMMFCAQCGASYVLGEDGKWHGVEIGDFWTGLV